MGATKTTDGVEQKNWSQVGVEEDEAEVGREREGDAARMRREAAAGRGIGILAVADVWVEGLAVSGCEVGVRVDAASPDGECMGWDGAESHMLRARQRSGPEWTTAAERMEREGAGQPLPAGSASAPTGTVVLSSALSDNSRAVEVKSRCPALMSACRLGPGRNRNGAVGALLVAPAVSVLATSFDLMQLHSSTTMFRVHGYKRLSTSSGRGVSA
eukprot:TRINITY_DN377_c0_g1_i20.p1 TRINITY_DN377_c0_g1~~TRINITY_DN377_c0_g1_i20.p1  ORF type:complete len:215 (+),score=27.96 TRINITY_DN377_c0_g1_i20:631-1275(+)